MVEEYTFRDLVHRAIQGCGYDKDDLFVKTVDYSCQPFYDIAINGSILDHLTSLSILKEFETRIHEKAAECPELNDPKYNGMFKQIIRWMIAWQFNDHTIEKGVKYHLADKFESTLNELIYIKGNPDGREKLKDDFRFIQNKKEEYKDFKKGKDLDAFRQHWDKKLDEQKQLLLPSAFINDLEEQLKKHLLIEEKDNLALVFSTNPVVPSQKVNWKGSQLALMFMFHILSRGPEYNNQSLYSFVADRFLVKIKPVSATKLANTYFNLIDTYFRKNRPALSINLLKILDILDLVINK